jgi:hypothetical protein
MKTKNEEVAKLRAKIYSTLLACETYDHLETCEKWFYKIRAIHPNRDFLVGNFETMFTYMYLSTRKKIINEYRENNSRQ